MGSRGPKSGDSFTVIREVRGAAKRWPLVGRATSAERANRLAARYRAMGGEPGATVTVHGDGGSRWVPWVWNGSLARWDRTDVSTDKDGSSR